MVVLVVVEVDGAAAVIEPADDVGGGVTVEFPPLEISAKPAAVPPALTTTMAATAKAAPSLRPANSDPNRVFMVHPCFPNRQRATGT
jgi:hypothetical protein